jgi:hypothetical protein
MLPNSDIERVLIGMAIPVCEAYFERREGVLQQHASNGIEVHFYYDYAVIF